MTTTKSIAVLPFVNVSTDEETGIFARGLSEEIVARLTRRQAVSNPFQGPDVSFYWAKLDIASGSASFQLAGSSEDLSVIAEKLNVAYLLGGSVERSGDILHITAQLIRARDGYQVWSKSYEHTFADRFETREGVAQNVAHIAESELSFDLAKRFAFIAAVYQNTNSEAYEHFINAWNQIRLMRLGEGGDSVLREQLLRKTVEADPDFALAYEILAHAYLERVDGSMSLQEASLKAHAAISRAIELNPDPTDATQELQLAQIYLSLDLDYANAETTFLRCVDRFPNYLGCRTGLARVAMREGRIKEALRQMATASVLDAGVEQALFLNQYAWQLRIAGEYERSLMVYADGSNLVLDGQGRVVNLRGQIDSLIMLGRLDEVKPLLADAWKLDGSANPEAYAYQFARVGEKERAERILAESGHDGANPYYVAREFLALGDVDNTFKAIGVAIEDHNWGVIDSLRTAEWWDKIRDDPRFDDMLERLDSKETHTERYLAGLDSEG